MYRHINLLPELIPEAEQFVVDNDRELYRPFFAALEKWCREENALVGGRMGVRLLTKQPLDKDTYKWEIYIESPYFKGKQLADVLYGVKSAHVSSRYISLLTNIKNRELTIIINTQMLVKIYGLDRGRGFRIADAVGGTERPGYFTNDTVKCIPEELQLVDVYRRLYSPANVKEWPALLETEAALTASRNVGEKHGGGGDNDDYGSNSDDYGSNSDDDNDDYGSSNNDNISNNDNMYEHFCADDYADRIGIDFDFYGQDGIDDIATAIEEYGYDTASCDEDDIITGGRQRRRDRPRGKQHGKNRMSHNNISLRKIETLIIDMMAGRKDTVLVGDYALAHADIAKLPQQPRLALLTAQPIDEFAVAVDRMAKEDLPNAKLVSSFRQHPLNLPTDFQITKHTLYVSLDGGKALSIADVYNSPAYELIPVAAAAAERAYQANPWVLLRFRYIELWVIKIISYIDDNPIWKTKTQQLNDSIWRLRRYTLTQPLETLFAANYIGVFTTEAAAKKKYIKEIGERYNAYLPAAAAAARDADRAAATSDEPAEENNDKL